VHFYNFLREADFSIAETIVKGVCRGAGRKYKVLDTVKCGQFGPRIFRVCFDFRVE